MLKNSLLGILIIVVIICVGYFILVILSQGSHNLLPPENHTATYMDGLERRIIRFALKNNRLPVDLENLPPSEDSTNRTTDVWGNPFKMTVDNDRVTLISYGKDKKPGGIGDNRDVISIFRIKTSDGKWVKEEDYNWIKRPLRNRPE